MDAEENTILPLGCQQLTDISPFGGVRILVDFSGFAHKDMLSGNFFLLAIALVIAMAAIYGCNTTTFLWKLITKLPSVGEQSDAALKSK
jgi:hypothetical protein